MRSSRKIPLILPNSHSPASRVAPAHSVILLWVHRALSELFLDLNSTGEAEDKGGAGEMLLVFHFAENT